MSFDPKEPFKYYEHVDDQLSVNHEFALLCALFLFQKADILDQGIMEKYPMLNTIKSEEDLYQFAYTSIPWLPEPELLM